MSHKIYLRIFLISCGLILLGCQHQIPHKHIPGQSYQETKLVSNKIDVILKSNSTRICPQDSLVCTVSVYNKTDETVYVFPEMWDYLYLDRPGMKLEYGGDFESGLEHIVCLVGVEPKMKFRIKRSFAWAELTENNPEHLLFHVNLSFGYIASLDDLEKYQHVRVDEEIEKTAAGQICANSFMVELALTRHFFGSLWIDLFDCDD